MIYAIHLELFDSIFLVDHDMYASLRSLLRGKYGKLLTKTLLEKNIVRNGNRLHAFKGDINDLHRLNTSAKVRRDGKNVHRVVQEVITSSTSSGEESEGYEFTGDSDEGDSGELYQSEELDNRGVQEPLSIVNPERDSNTKTKIVRIVSYGGFSVLYLFSLFTVAMVVYLAGGAVSIGKSASGQNIDPFETNYLEKVSQAIESSRVETFIDKPFSYPQNFEEGGKYEKEFDEQRETFTFWFYFNLETAKQMISLRLIDIEILRRFPGFKRYHLEKIIPLAIVALQLNADMLMSIPMGGMQWIKDSYPDSPIAYAASNLMQHQTGGGGATLAPSSRNKGTFNAYISQFFGRFLPDDLQELSAKLDEVIPNFSKEDIVKYYVQYETATFFQLFATEIFNAKGGNTKKLKPLIPTVIFICVAWYIHSESMGAALAGQNFQGTASYKEENIQTFNQRTEATSLITIATVLSVKIVRGAYHTLVEKRDGEDIDKFDRLTIAARVCNTFTKHFIAPVNKYAEYIIENDQRMPHMKISELTRKLVQRIV